MSSVSKPDGSSWPDDPPPLVRWFSWPVRDNVFKGSVVVIGLLAGGLGVGWVTGKTHLALLALAALVIALWRFFLPVMFELNTDGVNQWIFGRHRRIPWVAIRRYEVFSTGVLLLPYSDRCPMDAFRGLYLPWGSRREEILAQIRYYLDQPGD